MDRKLFWLFIAAAGAAQAAGLPDGTKGTLDLKVAVQDELGVDTVSEMIELKNVKASELEGFIRARLSRWGAVQTNDALNMIVLTDKREKIRDLTALLKRLDERKLSDFVRLQTLSIPLKYTDPAELESPVRAQLSPEGQLVVDRSHNALVVTDLASKVERVKGLVAALDAFVPQAEVELAVLESNGDLMRNAGIDWQVLADQRVGVEASFEKRVNEYYSPGTDTDNRLTLHGLPDLTGFLSIATNKNKAKLALHSTLSAANGRSAELHGGSITPNFSTNYYSNYGSSNPAPSGPARAPDSSPAEGIHVRMQPRIGADGVATLSLDLSSNSLLGWRQDNSPIIDQRRVQTDAVLRDGEVLVLGGLKKSTLVEEEKGVPGLRYLLPFLFSRRSSSQVEEDVTFLLRLKLRLKPEDGVKDASYMDASAKH